MGNTMLNMKVLPHSGGRYYVSENSDIISCNGDSIISFVKNGIKYVNIDWYKGICDYEVGLLILVTEFDIGLDHQYYDRLKVIYKDNNPYNVFKSNLTHVFTEPIESTVKDYYFIPNFPDYGINRMGDVITLKDKRQRKWYIKKATSDGNRTGGYEYNTFYNGKYSTNIFKHRILCLVFKPFTGDFSKLTVNHIDGDKTNNTLDNLEWCTYSQNNKHAWNHGLKLNNRDKIYVRNLITNEQQVFRSVRKCSESFGDTSGHYISERIEDKSGKIYPDLLQFKRGDDPWPEVDAILLSQYDRDSFQNRFVARNVFTGEITLFDHAVKGEKLLNIPARIILDHARNSKFIPYQGYNFRYFTEVDKFPEHSERHLAIYKDYPVNAKAGVVAKDIETGEELFFTSMPKCIEYFQSDFSYISTYIYSGRPFKKRYILSLFLLKPRNTSQSAAKLVEP